MHTELFVNLEQDRTGKAGRKNPSFNFGKCRYAYSKLLRHFLLGQLVFCADELYLLTENVKILNVLHVFYLLFVNMITLC